ncbi:unnamed protein product [Caenorhabditis nigoni]
MKNFIVLLFIATASNAQNVLLQTPGPLADQQRLFAKIDETSVVTNPYDTDYDSSGHHIFRRDTPTNDTVSLVVERMQMMARLTNAISLQKQLIDGTVDPDKLIPELLHFGSVTPSQIHALKFADVISALELLKSLPSNLKSEDSIMKLEELFDKIDGMLKTVEGIEDVTVWPEKDTFKIVIDKLANRKATEFPLIPDLVRSLRSWNVFYEESIAAGAKAHYISQLGETSSEILEAVEKLKSKTPTLSLFPDGKTATEMVQFVEKVVNGVAKVGTERFRIPAKGFEHWENNLREINSVVANFKSARKNVDLITNLFISRANGEKSSTYTLALSEGYNDIIRLMGHFNDPWFQQTVKDNRLSKSFESLRSLESLNIIESLLCSKGSLDQNAAVMSDIVKTVSDLETTFGTFVSGATESMIEHCLYNSDTYYEDNDLRTLIKKADEIDQTLERLQDVFNSFLKDINNETFIKNLQEFVRIGQIVKKHDEASKKIAFEEFGKLTIKEVTAKFLKRMVEAGYTVTVSSFESLAKDAQKLLGAFDKLLQQASGHVKVLNCFIKSANAKPAVRAITASKAVRYSEIVYKEKVDNAIKVVKSLESTKKDLKFVETLIMGIKSFTSPESDLLFNLKNDVEVSEKIGSSVNAITGMKKAIASKADIDAVQNNFVMVISEASNAKSLSGEDKKNLVDLGTASLHKMFSELDSWKTGVSSLSFTNLTSYGQVFSKAKKINGINLDVAKTRKSLKKLIEEVTDPSKKDKLKKVQDGLDALDGMGMQFSSYANSFDRTTSSLELLENFFSSFAASISATASPPSKKIFNKWSRGQF